MTSSDPISENMHSVEKKVKERKEKTKKQDKIADASDHAETRPEIVRGARTKKKKTVDPGTPVEPEPVPSNPEEKEKRKRKRGREDEGPLSGDKKEKKKRKKEKASDVISDLATDPSPEVADAKVAGTTMVASEVKEKKRRKKNKSSTEASNPPPSAIEPTPSPGAADRSEKLQKREPAKDDTINAGADAEPSSESKSKSKKRKKGKVVEDEDHSTSSMEDSSRKRKKSKKSIHPDPSDDPDLTEQSRKALTHIYSRSTSPETWKFNKARQNWIIRNVWTSKVPEKYVPMVVDYLSKVQGRVRETLIESCNKLISDPSIDPPAPQAVTNEKGSSENPNPPAPNTIESERTQRAHSLLHALTKKS